MTPLRFVAGFLLLARAVMAGSSADYTLEPAALDSGGLRGASADYVTDRSSAPGQAGTSPEYLLRSGFAGQLSDAISLALVASPATVDESASRQLAGLVNLDDDTLQPLPAASVVWSILTGPIAAISPDGLATSAPVYQNTAATVQGRYRGLTGNLSLTVLETVPDNFHLYAGDRLPDPWQVQYLGPANPQGGQTGDPDGDGYSNLLEFAFGTDPANPASGFGDLRYAAGVITQRGQPILSIASSPAGVSFQTLFGRRKDYLTVGLSYTVQFSADLLSWHNGNRTFSVAASDAEMDVVPVRYPFFLSDGRKAQFFRVKVTLP